MTPRLLAIAGFVPYGSRVADIGADHARLSVWLARRNGCRCIATDKSPGPLNTAKARIEAHGNPYGIEFRLGDGLDCVSPDEVDVIVAAGMGGETVAGILRPWARDKLCILQPNTHPERLEAFLAGNGYNITGGITVPERGRVYSIIVTGAVCKMN
ncbi:MAG: class I SAM-dependent methyltransferase [Oscillospiraceae bacterium]|nr:class I SAM-dependent methyltransferase [Oscillospiraceae bacterium]